MDNYKMGIDIGSTTAKIVILDQDDIVFSAYQRHNAETLVTIHNMLQVAYDQLGDQTVDLLVTGSASMGIGEVYDLPFIQEVVASAEVIQQRYPDVRTFIDIGGEDAKIIFFNEDGRPDIRMNGSCAGGTGAFIDEMGSLMNITVGELDQLASLHQTVYPMASRCGVFAKTDVQNLLSREIPREDIAASIFNSIVLQTLATLARGYKTVPKMFFAGGPLTFLPALKGAFVRVLGLKPCDVIEADRTELLPAIGAALAKTDDRKSISLKSLIHLLHLKGHWESTLENRLRPLFKDNSELSAWIGERERTQIGRVEFDRLAGKDCYLGVDSGSTTTKLVLIDAQANIAFDYYCNNNGRPIQAVQEGLRKIRHLMAQMEHPPLIKNSVVTGYGEDLIRSAFGFDEGIVETLAHYQAAKLLDENVSFILDIGGQDMKAIFVKNGHIQNIEINEACSSGCGSFIESFARSMEYNVAEFSQLACRSKAPCDLGTRCTVFMNSSVKQSLREGASINDISAGLAYSVIKNALHKVLKITNTEDLGESIVVQGGTFRNLAILKAVEILLDRPVLCPDIAELMGSYGAAISAHESFRRNPGNSNGFIGFENLSDAASYTKKSIHCRGCENRCTVTKLEFPNGNVFFTGNRCENIYNNSGKTYQKGTSLPSLKYKLLFERNTTPDGEPHLTIGIPRVLGMFEQYPFWNTLFVESGFQVHLSGHSSKEMYEKGADTIMSENICYPAKIVHGHIVDLIEASVDRIFFPMVFYEMSDFSNARDFYVCPIVSGYSDVIQSAVDPEGVYGIPMDSPAVNFNEVALLKKACYRYLASLGIPKRVYQRAFRKALDSQLQYRRKVKELAARILEKAKSENRRVVLLLGRPYHIDPYINHKVPDILKNFGVDIITEDSVPLNDDRCVPEVHGLTQWEYINRMWYAADWAGQNDDVDTVQLNSFGCGPDAFAVDEVNGVLGQYQNGYTVLRIDEIESTGSMKLRLRSLIEAKNRRKLASASHFLPRINTKVYDHSNQGSTLIVPPFADFCTPPLVRPAFEQGHQVVILPPSDRHSVDLGLKYANNEICYPATILIGDVIKALRSGEHNLSKTAVALWETGGQCRASCIFTACKKAMVSAGFENIPVVTVSTLMNSSNEQSGFRMNIRKYIFDGVLGMVLTDSLSSMYHATAVREVHRGQAEKVANKYNAMLLDGSIPLARKDILETIRAAVKAFNQIETNDFPFPKVGIVGEIYVKYNGFSNNNVISWLIDQGIEVVVPPLLEFFISWFVSVKVHVSENMVKPHLLWLLSGPLNRYLDTILDEVDEIMQDYQYYTPQHKIQHVAKKAEKILSLTHQYGEGWMIAGGIGTLVEDGVPNVLCLQPFGCIANHVTAKGVEKRLRQHYPQLNLLLLDNDAGVSEVNYFNRMHFFINQAKAAQTLDQVEVSDFLAKFDEILTPTGRAPQG
jgi:predicted CoA-substrate-specific enzyme activase